MGNRSVMLALLTVLSLFGFGSAFLYGFGRRFPAVGKSSCLMCSAPPTNFSTQTNEETLAELQKTTAELNNILRSTSLQCAQMSVDATVFSAIENSPFLKEKYPDSLNRTIGNVLDGLSNITDIEYLNTLPTDDPRRHFLATIQNPGQERRAELNENLQAIDAERGADGKEVSTYSMFLKRSREGMNEDLAFVLDIAVEMETLRRKRQEYSEYGNQEWHASIYADELQQFIQTCYEDTENGIVCTYPCFFVYFPYYKAGEPPKNYTIHELNSMNANMAVSRSLLHTYFDNVIYPAIAESPNIAEKYPNPADRTPRKLLGGLANIVSIEYMQSLEPHDPRRLFLDTVKTPDEQRHIELAMNALLVDRAVTKRQKYEPGAFSVRHLLFRVVREALEENYLSTLTAAALGEHMPRYGNNHGVETEDAYGDSWKMVFFKRSRRSYIL